MNLQAQGLAPPTKGKNKWIFDLYEMRLKIKSVN
jgi:hypothetical protein